LRDSRAGSRVVPFAGVTNFRDLGGYPALRGKTTRWGLVYRSDGLHRLTVQDMEIYRQLGINTVYDLRSDAERALHPNPLPCEHLPLLAEGSRPGSARTPPAGPDPDESAGADPDGTAGTDRGGRAGRAEPDALYADGGRLLRQLYRDMLATSAPVLGRLLAGLADGRRLPAVFHCTGGKDRTGLGAAILLEVLGVPRDVVLDDYELTSRYRRREHQTESYANLVASGLTPAAAAVVLGAPRWAMADALDALDEMGGAESYVIDRAGVPRPTVEQLRAILLEEPVTAP
jgi:protein-tyrosine phosphatase